MGWRSVLGAAVVAMSLSACLIEIDFTGTRFLCAESPECPGDLICVEGVCTDELVDPPPADAGVDAVSGDDSLVLRWTFNEPSGLDVLDASGNGLDGVIENATRVAGLDGGAIEFDEVLDHVILQTAPDSLKPTAAVAMAVWVQFAGVDDGEVVSLGDSYAIRAVAGGDARIFVYDGVDFTGATTAGGELGDGDWHHVVGQYTGGQLQVYVDGVLGATTDHTAPIDFGLGASLVAGKHGEVNDAFDFVGLIDDISIYDRALDQAEITALSQRR